MLRIIEFASPMFGIEGEFNTFRLSGAWAKRVEPGSKVILMNKKEYSLMGWAEVTAVHVGRLDALSALHGFRNHNQKHLPPEGAKDRLIAAMVKRYGPNKCGHHSRVTVIDLKCIEWEEADVDVAAK